MLRIHCLQLWFDLSDPAVEESMYDSRALRAFVGIEQVAKAHHRGLIRHRLAPQVEQNKLGEKIFEAVGRVLQARGLRLSKGTIVDATIIAAPVRRRTSPTRRSRPAIAPTSGPWQRNRGNPAAFLPMPEACAMASGADLLRRGASRDAA